MSSEPQPPYEVGETVYLEESGAQPWVIVKPCERREGGRRTGGMWWAIFIGKSLNDEEWFVSDDRHMSREPYTGKQ